MLRGFACGTFQSSDEAGASADAAKKAGQNVQYKAKVIDAGRWIAELRIPFASLGFAPAAGAKYKFNLSVRKQGDDPWIEWYGTGSQTWYLPGAASVRFVK